MDLSITLSLIGTALAECTALIALTRNPRSYAQRMLCLGLVVLGAESFCSGMGLAAVLPEDILFWQRLRLLALAWLPGVCLAFSLAYARANYEDFLRRWRAIRYAAVALPVATAALFWGDLVTAYEPGPELGKSFIAIGWGGWGLHVLLIVGLTLALMNVERTLRASTGVMRWRIKYMAFALAVILSVRIYSSAEALLYRNQMQTQEGLNAAALVLGCLLMLVALFRTGRSRLDLYLSHTVLSHSVTLLLAGGYLLTVGLVARVVVRLGAVRGFPVAAFMVLVALLGLTILLTSDRLRERIRRFVSRHLRRPHYDYRVVWSDFAGRTAAIVDRDEYCRTVTRIVAETLQALSVTLWTVDEARGRLRFGASTSLSGAEAKDLVAPGLDAADLVAAMRDRPLPVDLDESDAEWAEQLRQRYPDFFHKGSHRICLPLSAAGRLLGIMVLGDRVNGQPYSGEEFSLLNAMGGQIGARLLNIELSGRLLEAKQMEAFQTMSTFFVHDLKNTTSTLSLMLQNLPKHFEDPAFRQDALRAIGNSVEKMNGLIRRLTMLRQKLDMTFSATSLNDVVESAIAGAGFTGQAQLVKRLGTLAPTALDPDQMQKVVVNLLINAREASGPGGEIAVETTAHGGWVVLAVRDAGSGMSREFVEQHLFRPFHSTKKEGMGIGLYQSRMIVEAHRGRIEVESSEGHGSTFRVFLPAQGGTE